MMRYAIAACAVFVLVGCATPRFTFPTVYRLDAPIEIAKAEPCGKTLGVRTLESARPYRQNIVYRESAYVIGAYDRFQWAEMPADRVTRAIMDALVATGRFKDVGNAADLIAPDWILTGALRTFDEDRTTNPWTAQCEIRLELRDAQKPDEVWAATITDKEPLERNATDALPAAMSRVLARIVKQAAEQIAAR